MRCLRAVPLLLAVLLGGQEAISSSISDDSEDTAFLTNHSRPFLQHVKKHFDESLNYLFTGNAYADKSVEKPGMAKLLRDQSDRHWELGIAGLKKFFQRGGKSDAPSNPNEHSNFRSIFEFKGVNSHEPVSQLRSNGFEGDKEYGEKYLKQIAKLVTDSKATALALNNLHRAAMARKYTDGVSSYDAEMAHFLEEKLEDEMSIMRHFRYLHTTFNRMKDLGLAAHFFDQSL